MHGSDSEFIGKYESKCEMEKFVEVGTFSFFFNQHCYNMHACVSRKKRCVIFLRMKMS